MNFNIDFTKIFIQFLPPQKRFEDIIAFFKSWLKPLNTTHSETFNVFYPDAVYFTKRNGQILILQNTLNTLFNPDLVPPIYIDDTGDDVSGIIFYNNFEGYSAVIMYNEAEAEAPLYWFTYEETFSNTDFIVYIPIAVQSNFTDEEIKFRIEKYKQAGKKFTTIYY